MIDMECCTIGFSGQYITVACDGKSTRDLLDFLFADLQWDENAVRKAFYTLETEADSGLYSFSQEAGRLYHGQSRYRLAYSLCNEVMYQCIVENTSGFAVHAAAIHNDGRGILLPGKSGAGKSTLVAWLTAHGYSYLTDELVILEPVTRHITPFTRPISYKKGSIPIVEGLVTGEPDQRLHGEEGVMIPHRMLGDNYSSGTTVLSCIIFPEFRPGISPRLSKLSGGLGCLKLMECYVNARNLKDHGMKELAEVVRDTPVYELQYGTFDGLLDLLRNTFPDSFT